MSKILPKFHEAMEALSSIARVPYSDRNIETLNFKGEVVFQDTVNGPETWSNLAISIVAEKYTKVVDGKPEKGVRPVLHRVANTLATWAVRGGYIPNESGFQNQMYKTLMALMENQVFAFNSPVFFNLGTMDTPQTSACFIGSIEDNMGDINPDGSVDLNSISGQQYLKNSIFKGGSGYGANWSHLRGKGEPLSRGGTSSGAMSFLRAANAFGGVLKSGGTTRRAAEMAILDIDHPEIMEFITAKDKEEQKMSDLLATGRWGSPSDIDSEASQTVHFQNMNFTVSLTNEFLEALENGDEWKTKGRVDTSYGPSYPARELWKKLCYSAWKCGDPGVRFHDLINSTNPCKEDFVIEASNPCSEFVFKNETACNLASIRLTYFYNPETGKFDWATFQNVVTFLTTCMDVLINFSRWPSPAFQRNSVLYRPLGLGHCDLGGMLLMAGVPYDSPEATAIASVITHEMTLTAFEASLAIGAAHEAQKDDPGHANWALTLGLTLESPSGPQNLTEQYKSIRIRNTVYIINMLRNHHAAAVSCKSNWKDIKAIPVLSSSVGQALSLRWDNLVKNAQLINNMQVTLLAPTGTISFMMDASTTGIEPEMFLFKTKRFVGGRMATFVGRATEVGLTKLGYDLEEVLANRSIEFKNERDQNVFRTAYGDNALPPEAHLHMCAAVQPFLSGAISKTISLPEGSTPEDVSRIFLASGRLGIKNVTVYVDGSKNTQPLSDGSNKKEDEAEPTPTPVVPDSKAATPQEGSRIAMGDKLNLVINHLSETNIEMAKNLLDALDLQGAMNFKRKMPADLEGLRHRFRVGTIEGYLHIDYDPVTARVIEIFCDLNKANSTLKGLVDCFCILTSMALQNGIPLKVLTDKFSYQRFEPSGFTGNAQIPRATSIIDYIMRYLALNHNDSIADYYAKQKVHGPGFMSIANPIPEEGASTDFGDDTYGMEVGRIGEVLSDAPTESDMICTRCGSTLVRTGTCHMCPTCGNQEGGCG